MNTVYVEGVDKIVAELDKAISMAIPEVTAVLSKGALNVKNDWRDAWKRLGHGGKRGHIGRLPYAITYDIVTVPGSIQAIIGPDKDKRQGALGNLIEFGSLNNPPHPGGSPALDREAPKVEAALDELLKKLLP